MRGKKAKAIRKIVYGDFSIHAKRKYGRHTSGMIINHPKGRRARYLIAKKLARAGVRV